VTPGARLAAVIEALDTIRDSRAAADEVLKAWGREHRFAGSKDRHAIAGRAYDVLRARSRLAWAMGGDGGRALVLGALRWLDGLDIAEIAALFDGQGYAPPPLSDHEAALLDAPQQPPPDWVWAGVPPFVTPILQARFDTEWLAEAQALTQDRAPVDLRVNTLRGGMAQALALLLTDGLRPERTALSAHGLRLPSELARDVQSTRAFATGWVEVQDEASQIAAALAGAQPGQTVVDYCAGGGGKTLALAAPMDAKEGDKGEGRLIALDVNAKRLDAIGPRLARAGAAAEVRRIGTGGEGSEDLAGVADLVFVDAPCSGSGAWRRHPEGTWRLTEETVQRMAAQQRDILAHASRLVRPGGRLVYATCSVLSPENEAVADAFEQAEPDFRPVPVEEAAQTPALTDAARTRLGELAAGGHMLQLTPRRTGTDGFFLALYERTA
jgi:16S rRNA (cytosine967-C5)-methyltransferase